MKKILLYLSKNKKLRDFIMRFRISRKIAARFVAGETIDEALTEITDLQRRGLSTTIDHLGEEVTSENEAIQACDYYLQILDSIHESTVDPRISLKLSQMGLGIDRKLCLENMRKIITRAKECNTFVTIDMEGSNYTSPTLEVFKTLRSNHRNVGIALQAYLYRTEDDLKSILEYGPTVRLCKGAYNEPPKLANPDKKYVDSNFIELLKIMFQEDSLKRGTYPEIATHDENIISWTLDYVKGRNIPNEKFEFQMLYGIRRRLQESLIDRGYRVRIYLPFGKEWYPFFMRRLAERPANLFFILKNFFKK